MTEPFSCGIGGGFMVVYKAGEHGMHSHVYTIDGREKAGKPRSDWWHLRWLKKTVRALVASWSKKERGVRGAGLP